MCYWAGDGWPQYESMSTAEKAQMDIIEQNVKAIKVKAIKQAFGIVDPPKESALRSKKLLPENKE